MLTTTENGVESCMDTKKRTGEVLTAATNEEVGPLTNSLPTGRLRLTRVLREASFSHVIFTSSSFFYDFLFRRPSLASFQKTDARINLLQRSR